MRTWLINIVKEAIKESQPEPMEIISERDPLRTDYHYAIGTKWKNGEKKFYLNSIKAIWIQEED